MPPNVWTLPFLDDHPGTTPKGGRYAREYINADLVLDHCEVLGYEEVLAR
jgi:hypothetical protein